MRKSLNSAIMQGVLIKNIMKKLSLNQMENVAGGRESFPDHFQGSNPIVKLLTTLMVGWWMHTIIGILFFP